ncbi:MAG TPA: class I SAM-dependent methyltransferase [Longimicrobiales bacterium]|nr:class I SAM-dependent methyltransferase [Longimicrobiales bacterium]
MHLYPPAERAVRSGHPWVYADGVERIRRPGEAGDLAVIFDHKDRFLAIGLYDPSSPLRVRILHHGDPVQIDRDWLLQRMRTAQEIRAPLAAQDTTGYRMIHGENDGLPGLVVDRYDKTLVVKLYTSAWLPHLQSIVDGLRSFTGAECIVLRLSRTVRRQMNDSVADGQVMFGCLPPSPVVFEENGLHFEVDPVRGQKTGFFLDQRDNRALVERYSAGKSVLNVFSYTGGFSVYAARGSARSVWSLDASSRALMAAERNFERNRNWAGVRAAQHRVHAGDAFDILPRLRDNGDRFDMVILDPPSFAKAEREVERALRSYERIIRMGMGLVASGGMLVAASCTSRIGAEQLRRTAYSAAAAETRRLEILQQTGHALDHPIGFPEGAYLKCIFARIDR